MPRTPLSKRATRRRTKSLAPLPKAPSGIRGLDEITGGGLPRGRPTLVCGGPGCGKTLFAMEFLVRGAVDYGEHGVFMAFEETAEELATNVASLGFDLRKLEAEKKLSLDYVRVERSEIEETGEYDLEGLFVRLEYAAKSVGAKRVVLDTIESLFSGLPNPAILRAELRRLFRWLKDRGLTVVITGEKGEGALTRQGLEEYVSDCVIFLDHRVVEQVSTRRLRIVKYRGTVHGTNEYPFLIDERGISILPLTSLELTHKVSNGRLSSGIPRLDEMLGGRGYYEGSSILVSGTAGTGKTSVAAMLVKAACARGKRCLYFAFEESVDQLVRNMRSIGIELQPWIDQGRLRVIASRPTIQGLEKHLVLMHREVEDFRPAVVAVDPITNLISVGSTSETQSMLTRLLDFLKLQGITTFFTSLTSGNEALEQTELGISSLIDTWLVLAIVRSGGERNRTLTIVKSRGMAHSNQAVEYRLSRRGLDLVDTYLGTSGVLTGSARVAKEAEDQAQMEGYEDDIALREQERERRQRRLEAQITGMREELAADLTELERGIKDVSRRRERLLEEREMMARSRQAFSRHAGRTPPRGRSQRERP
jgi:circadian clock protein KaiC